MKNNKIKSITAALCTCIFSLGLVSTAHATLESRLGGLAYYDTDLDITWLADANAGAGSSFDDGFATTDGLMTWANANAWVALAEAKGITVIMNRCPKIEYGRLSGEISWQGVNSRILSSKRPALSTKGFQKLTIDRRQ